MRTAEPLLIADSFRVRRSPSTGAAEVRGFARHLDRFRSAVRALDPARTSDIERFLTDVRFGIAESSPGFPRLECSIDLATGAVSFDLALRPLPPLGTDLHLRTVDVPGLSHPALKGPNIDRYQEANRALGAEGLRLDATGGIVEGLTTSLLWWSSEPGELRRIAPPRTSSPDRIPSVTEALLIERIAPALGVSVGAERPTRDELRSHEVWAVNALHGIRRVRTIDGLPVRASDSVRLARWQQALDTTWEPVLP